MTDDSNGVTINDSRPTSESILQNFQKLD